MSGGRPPNSSASICSASPKSSISGDLAEMDIDDIRDFSVSDVIHLLKSSFRADVFRKAEAMLRLREERLAKDNEERDRSLKRLEFKFQVERESLEAELESSRRRCGELEERNRKAEADFERRMKEAEESRGLMGRKFGEMELAKGAVEEELEDHKRLCKTLAESIGRLKEDHRIACEREHRNNEMIAALENDVREKFAQISELKAKNRNLECAKWRAESDVEESRKRCRELEERVSEMDVEKSGGKARKNRKVSSVNGSCSEENGEKGSSRMIGEQNAGLDTTEVEDRTFSSVGPIHASANVASACHSLVGGTCTPNAGGRTGGHYQKPLSFKEDGVLGSKVMQDAHLKVVREIVVVSDDDNEVEVLPMSSIKSSTPASSKCVCGRTPDGTRETIFGKSSSSKSNQTSKITGAANDRSNEGTSTPSLATDRNPSSKTSASDDEDDIPISQLLWKKLKEEPATSKRPSNTPGNESHVATALSSSHEIVEESVTPSRVLLVAPKAREAECESTRTAFLAVQDLSPKTGKSIAGEFDCSENEHSQANVSEDETECDKTNVSEEETDSETSLGELLEKMRWRKSQKWDYKADMLSSFSKDPLLCMSAVCAIYRQQISNKQSGQQTQFVKNRGFLAFDMLKGSELALYLMDGDCKGPLKKSVEELEKHDPKAVDHCLQLASLYSKQLFEIYQNQEDIFFP